MAVPLSRDFVNSVPSWRLPNKKEKVGDDEDLSKTTSIVVKSSKHSPIRSHKSLVKEDM